MAQIHPTALIGVELRPLQGMTRTQDGQKYGQPHIQETVHVGPFCVIGMNVYLDDKVIVDAYCKIDPNVHVGSNTLIIYRASLGSGAVIGRDCVVGGTVSEGTVIGDRCRTFGKLIHTHANSTMPWDHRPVPEPSPTVLNDSFVAHGALVMGGVTISPRAYICAGAIVTRDVPTKHIAFGCNQIIPHNKWAGQLRGNPLFE